MPGVRRPWPARSDLFFEVADVSDRFAGASCRPCSPVMMSLLPGLVTRCRRLQGFLDSLGPGKPSIAACARQWVDLGDDDPAPLPLSDSAHPCRVSVASDHATFPPMSTSCPGDAVIIYWRQPTCCRTWDYGDRVVGFDRRGQPGLARPLPLVRRWPRSVVSSGDALASAAALCPLARGAWRRSCAAGRDDTAPRCRPSAGNGDRAGGLVLGALVHEHGRVAAVVEDHVSGLVLPASQPCSCTTSTPYSVVALPGETPGCPAGHPGCRPCRQRSAAGVVLWKNVA